MSCASVHYITMLHNIYGSNYRAFDYDNIVTVQQNSDVVLIL